MLTRWGKALDRRCPLPEYPRPQMVRDSYVNLNGVWDFCVDPKKELPEVYDDSILVPFSPEAPLSGAAKKPGPEDYLHYRRRFILPEGFRKDRVLLHFGAADRDCQVYVNRQPVCKHSGGYWPFTGDITGALLPGENTLEVTVRDDPRDMDPARGKQREKGGGIWYTGQSGIWQTVWMESVPEAYIRSLRITPDLDAGCVTVELDGSGPFIDGNIVMLTDKGRELASAALSGPVVRLTVPEVRPWTPEDPYLYGLRIRVGEDRVESYFAMRKFGYTRHRGHRVLALNNKPYFHCGLLDQGYWPDGLLTPPSDEAMVFDIQTAKRCGFNMLRKHIKIEPLRWYYHCDRLGMLVWQDMVSGGGPYSPALTSWLPILGACRFSDARPEPYGRAPERSRELFRREMEDTVALLYNCPCIAVWVPFNEGWGQFDTLKIAERLRALDPGRCIDHASGWHDRGWDEMQSRHIYFRPVRLKNDGRALCLTEFGGYVLAVPGHKWCEKPFGYKVCADGRALLRGYRKLWEGQLLPCLEREGLTAAVYTQLSDVEQEMNGLLTYDREVLKLPAEELRQIHGKLRF